MNQFKSIIKSVYDYLINQSNLKNHREYKLLWEKYYEYNRCVKTRKKTFDIYMIDSINNLSNFTYDNKISPQALQEMKDDYSKVLSIFQFRNDLILNYFEQSIFNLEIALNLINEFNSTTSTNIYLNTPINSQKEEIIDTITTKMNTNKTNNKKQDFDLEPV
jgi:hypothetical protein